MKKTVKKRKVKKKAIFVSLVVLIILLFAVFYVFNFHITNIFISGNTIYTDQQIIDKLKLDDYPRTFNHSALILKHELEKDKYILKANVKKKNLFREVYIYIEENIPLFIYNNETILKDGTKVNDKFEVPTLVNEIESEIVYNKLIKSLLKVDSKILHRISEIKYEPNEVDKERFLLFMNDGNNVYITLRKITNINDYIDIISAFNSKKGVLYLDSGEYFEPFGG